MMIAARRQERGIAPKPLGHLKSEHVAIEGEGAFQVGDLEVHVTDADLRVHGAPLSAADYVVRTATIR